MQPALQCNTLIACKMFKDLDNYVHKRNVLVITASLRALDFSTKQAN